MKPRQQKQIDPNTVVLIKQIVLGVLILGFVGALFTGLWYGTRISALTISEVAVSGGETIDLSKVKEVVEQQLAGEYAGLIPKRFAWFYPEEAIKNAVLQVDRVHNVVAERKGTKLAVTFDEYVPSALWCESVESDTCLFLDQSGYAFATAPRLDGGKFLRFVDLTETPAVHESITDTVSIETAESVVNMLAQQGWYISHVEIGQSGDVFLSLTGGGELKVDLNRKPEETVDNLLTLLASDEFSHLKPGNFQYIDLRFGNKLFVNEELAAPQGEAASTSTSSSDPLQAGQ